MRLNHPKSLTKFYTSHDWYLFSIAHCAQENSLSAFGVNFKGFYGHIIYCKYGKL